MKALKLFALLAVASLLPTAAFASTLCPTFSHDPISGYASDGTYCNVVLTINANGTVTVTGEDTNHSFNGSGDQLIGVIDNYAGSVTSLLLNGGTNKLFAFDGDGIDTLVSHISNSTDKTGYGGPDSYFTDINGAKTTGTVDFVSALTKGETTYFSLEGLSSFCGGSGFTAIADPPSTSTPEPASLVLLGTGVLGIAGSLRRRFTTAK